MTKKLDLFFYEENMNNLKVRILIFSFSILIALIGLFILTPMFSIYGKSWIDNNINHKGLIIFLSHFSSLLPSTLLNVGLLIIFIKKRYYKPFINFNKINYDIFYGIIGGLILTVIIAVPWYITGGNFVFEIPWYGILGNLFSNLYEVIIFRVLILLAFLYLFKNKTVAILASSILFGLAHQQYPLIGQLFVAFNGIILSLVFVKTKNVISTWVSHQVSDMILDTIIKL